MDAFGKGARFVWPAGAKWHRQTIRADSPSLRTCHPTDRRLTRIDVGLSTYQPKSLFALFVATYIVTINASCTWSFRIKLFHVDWNIFWMANCICFSTKCDCSEEHFCRKKEWAKFRPRSWNMHSSDRRNLILPVKKMKWVKNLKLVNVKSSVESTDSNELTGRTALLNTDKKLRTNSSSYRVFI